MNYMFVTLGDVHVNLCAVGRFGHFNGNLRLWDLQGHSFETITDPDRVWYEKLCAFAGVDPV